MYNFSLLLTRKMRDRELSMLFLLPVGLELGYLLTPKNLNSFSEFMSPLSAILWFYCTSKKIEPRLLLLLPISIYSQTCIKRRKNQQ